MNKEAKQDGDYVSYGKQSSQFFATNTGCTDRGYQVTGGAYRGGNKTSLFKASLPFFEPPPVGGLGLMDITVVRVFVLQALGLGLGVRGHLHIANLLSALLALPFIPPSMWTFSRFNGGTHLRSPGKLCRGFVQVFLASPFHVRILTRKSIQHQEKKHKRA